MAPRKRGRTASSPSPSAAVTPKITLSGGEAHHSSLIALWRKERLTDIALCAEGVEFKAHRAALASSSDYFLSLFDSGMRDAASPTHVIEGLRSPVLGALLSFVYEGSCEVEESLLTEMLDASARLVIDSLKAACAFAIQSQLAPCNALDVWRLADLYTLPTLEKAAVTSALRGFEELPPQSASGAQVLALVQEDRLVAKSEEAVFQWVVRWWDAGERPEAELLAAMKHVRFAVMDAGFVQTTVRTWSAGLALDSEECRGVISALLLDAGRTTPRLGFALIYVLGGSGDMGDVSTVDVYDPRTDAWKQVSSMPITRAQHGSVALEGKIYAAGGYGVDPDDIPDNLLSTAHVYDPQSDQWQQLANLAIRCTMMAAAEANGKMYTIGGKIYVDDDHDNEVYDNEVTATVEAFDPQLGAWAEVSSMNVKRCDHAAAVVDGKIYVIGGFNGTEGDGTVLDSVEVYDSQADSWQNVASMPHASRMHAAAVMDGKIFVSGGMSTVNTWTQPMSTVMVFAPQANTWTELASMGTARNDHTSAAIGGKLYVFGGLSPGDRGERTASVEAYDPISNTWAQVSDLPSARNGLKAVVL